MTDSTVDICTHEFKISRGRLLRSALFTWHSRLVWIILAALIFAGSLCAVFIDWRWALVTAMVILVLTPGVMALMYINYALSPRCVPEVYDHKVKFDDKGFTVTARLLPLNPDDENEKPRTLSYTASYTDVAQCRYTADAMVLVLRGTPPGLVHIPYSALEDARNQCALIADYCAQKRGN